MEERIHAYFSGRVQGVGFRFTARSLAFRYKLKGWVKNLYDGRVELTIQGNSKDLSCFLQDLRSEFREYIEDDDVEHLKPASDLSDFAIKF